MGSKICGEFPEFCYKAFDSKEYKKKFIDSGIFRLNCLGYCRNMESISRRDPTEGFGCTKEPGTVTYYGFTQNPREKPAIKQKYGYQEHRSEYGNKIYCFCTCLPDVHLSHMKDKFGEYIVKINAPRKLAEDINNYFISNGRRFLIVGCKVVYNKGQELDRKLEDNKRLDLAYKQKPVSFSNDCEFRIVAIELGKVCNPKCKFLDVDERSEPDCKFIEVNLNKSLDYLCLSS